MPSKDEQAARKGKAAEQLIAAVCVLATGTELNALTALVDDEGVDLAFKHRDGTRTLDVQVKARFSDEAGSKATALEAPLSSRCARRDVPRP
jgi:hypothetical protein